MRSGRRATAGLNVWPGFVDALSSLLLVIIFVLLVFVLTQFYLGAVLSGRDQTIGRLSRQLNEMTEVLDVERAANAELKVNIGRLTEELQNSATERDKLQADLQKSAMLQHDFEALKALKDELEKKVSSLADQSADDRKLSDSARAQAALLNQQLEAMRQELAKLAVSLTNSEALSVEQKVEIANLGTRLNSALAGKVEELVRYRSEFFGRLRQLIGDQPGIRVEGDRFVFQSELLFPSGSADLGEDGQARMAQLAHGLTEVTKRIPPDINWVLRVDGHTDKVPIKSDRFPSNWELSTARAVTLVKFLAAQGVPPERLAAAGFGEFQPVDKGNAPAALAKNRRIEIRLDQR